MSQTARELSNKLSKFVANIDSHVAEAVRNNSKVLLKLQGEQHDSSILSTGKSIKPLYSKSYAKHKGFKRPDLYAANTKKPSRNGAFRRSMYLHADPNQYHISSHHWLKQYLVGMYGIDIFNIAPVNRSEAKNTWTTEFTKILNDKLR